MEKARKASEAKLTDKLAPLFAKRLEAQRKKLQAWAERKLTKSIELAELEKAGDCGANADGGGGFQPGNTCGAGGAGGGGDAPTPVIRGTRTGGFKIPPPPADVAAEMKLKAMKLGERVPLTLGATTSFRPVYVEISKEGKNRLYRAYDRGGANDGKFIQTIGHDKLVTLLKAEADDEGANKPNIPAKPKKVSIEEIQRAISVPISDEIFKLLEQGLADGGKQMEDLLGIKFRENDPDVIAYLKEQRTNLEDVLDESAARMVKDTLEAGYKEGESERVLIQRLVDSGSFAESRAQRIARTESHAATMSGAYQGMRQGGVETRKWLSASDELVRDTHAEADGQEVGIDEPYQVGDAELMYPGDPDGPAGEVINCFPGHVRVQGSFVAGTRSLYAGPMREIVTRNGRKLTVTPNHPVATPKGFVAAGALNKGDDLIGYSSEARRDCVSRIVDDKQNNEATIEQVFDALRACGSLRSREVSVDDFHGDGRSVKGKIEVVVVEGALRDEAASFPGQDSPEVFLEDSDVRHAGGSRAGAGALALGGINTPPARVPSFGALPKDGGTVKLELAPFEALRFGSASHIDSKRTEPRSKYGAGDAGFIRELLERFPGQVATDEIVEIRDFEFSGHVYDLQGVGGWIVAEGIIESNCRCTEIIVRASVSPEDFADALEMAGSKLAQDDVREAIKDEMDQSETGRLDAGDVDKLKVARGSGDEVDYDAEKGKLTIGPKADPGEIADAVREHIVSSVTTATDARNFMNELGTGKLPEPAISGTERQKAVQTIARVVTGDRKGAEDIFGQKLSDKEWARLQVIGKHYFLSAGTSGAVPAKEKR